jgi:hypothetical protein
VTLRREKPNKNSICEDGSKGRGCIGMLCLKHFILSLEVKLQRNVTCKLGIGKLNI